MRRKFIKESPGHAFVPVGVPAHFMQGGLFVKHAGILNQMQKNRSAT